MFVQTKYDLGDVVLDEKGVQCSIMGIQVRNDDGRPIITYWLDNYESPKYESELTGV